MAVRDAATGREVEPVFPLVPTRRGRRLDVSGRTSRRRGSGGEVAGSRPYRRGDAVRLVDWHASARLSTARAADEFVVRERYSEDVVRVLLVVDRAPTMRLFPAGLPWLHKPDAVRVAARLILASAGAAQALAGYAETGAGAPWIRRPGRDRALRREVEARLAADAGPPPPRALDALLLQLTRSTADVPPGTFVFLVSDWLTAPDPGLLRTAVGLGWDLVPVIVQDATWERSFPDVSGATLPLADPVTGDVRLVRLRRSEARARREANEDRARALRDTFLGLGLDHVVLATAERGEAHAAFLAWARSRLALTRSAR
jgi:uncharacterized protein (DUF58 family)